jgi:hypothetical protein
MIRNYLINAKPKCYCFRLLEQLLDVVRIALEERLLTRGKVHAQHGWKEDVPIAIIKT